MALGNDYRFVISGRQDADAVAVRVRRQNAWEVRFGRDLDAPELVAALAFVFIGRWASW